MKFKTSGKKETKKKDAPKKATKKEVKKKELKELVTETVEEVLKEQGITPEAEASTSTSPTENNPSEMTSEEKPMPSEPTSGFNKQSEEDEEGSANGGQMEAQASTQGATETTMTPVENQQEKPREEDKEKPMPSEPVKMEGQPVEKSSESSPTSDTPAENPSKSDDTLQKEATMVTTPIIPTTATPTADSPVSDAPVENPGKKPRFLLVLLVLFILGILLGGGFWYAYTQHMISLPSFMKNVLPKAKTTTTATTPMVTPTEIPVDLTKYKISVLNGSGIAGEAAKVKTTLTDAGFTVDTTGNAVTSDYKETFIAAKENVDPAFLGKLTEELGKTYTVSKSIAKLTDTDTADVIVTIGK